jgi:imidazolonepropionase-like amidohydrolase
LIVILSTFCCLTRAADQVQSLVIRAGKIWTVTDGVITNGVIVINNGKIESVGEKADIPATAKILEMSGKNVVPGFIDAHCHIGLSLNVLGEMDETVAAVAADMQILDAFNPQADGVRKALRSGVTTVLLSPGNKNPIAGQTAVVKLDAGKAKGWILKRNAGVKFSLRDEALMPDREPTSRAGLAALIRDELNQAKAHQAGAFDPGRDVLERVADANLPAYVCAYTVDEIASAMAIIDEFKLNAVLIGAGQGDEITDMIARQNLPVIYPSLLLFSRDKDLRRAGKLASGGVKLAFGSAAPKTTLSDLRTSAILAAKYGLDTETALRSLTINAAEILGVADRVGSIQQGKDADLVILNGDPLELTSSVEMVLINGNIVYQRREE